MSRWRHPFRRRVHVSPYTKDLLRDSIARHGHEIGDYTYGPLSLLFDGAAKLRIGRYCSIAGGVTILLGGNHRADWVTTYPFGVFAGTWPEASGVVGHPATNGDVRIGNDVWLGLNATILSGISIGDGAVVAAHALVTQDVPPYAIVGGNPAHVIRYRFKEGTIARLLRIRWWDWPEERVHRLLPLLMSADIDRFCDAAEAVADDTAADGARAGRTES